MERECSRGRWWSGIEVAGRSGWMEERLFSVTVTPLCFLKLRAHCVVRNTRGVGRMVVEWRGVKTARTNECTKRCLFGSFRSDEFVIPSTSCQGGLRQTSRQPSTPHTHTRHTGHCESSGCLADHRLKTNEIHERLMATVTGVATAVVMVVDRQRICIIDTGW